MKPYYRSRFVSVYHGDCLTSLQALPDQSIQCCVTSPPYWGLRDYGTAKWEGGRARCDHKAPRHTDRERKFAVGTGFSSWTTREETARGGHCRKCGATRIDAQLGLEPTPEAYVARMVEVFREVRRVLKDDGTLWLNLGDSYSQATVGTRSGGTLNQWKNGGRRNPDVGDSPIARASGLPAKNLTGIPWRVAFALQADGWYLRSDIIWSKPNPMPESVTDRPTKSHEYLFLLAKSQRYYYDAAAVREPFADARMGNPKGGGNYMRALYPVRGQYGLKGGQWTRGAELGGRNRRTVWTVTTRPFKGAHFATFPPKLVEPCILAGSRPGDVVLDPFSGAATTGLVAQEHGRKYVGLELNADYCEMSVRRLCPDTRLKQAA